MYRPHSSHLFFLASILVLALVPLQTLAAFTLPVFSANDTIDLNAADTWCYYPSVNTTNDLSVCTGSNADLFAVIQTHLSQPPRDSLSIAYYSASLERLGGADFPVGYARGRKVYLCVSGQREDGRYKTMCEVARRDNEFGPVEEREREEGEEEEEEEKAVCAREVGQVNVSDGCYVPVGMEVEGESAARGLSHPTTPLLLLATLLSLGGWLSSYV